MPELPEVETTRLGLTPLLVGRRVCCVHIDKDLRFKIPEHLPQTLSGQTIRMIKRRGKYLLFGFDGGILMVHLGMSGTLRVVAEKLPKKPHDHFSLNFENGRTMRLNDPRRFGIVAWTADGNHPLLNHLGREPLAENFNGDYLYGVSRRRKRSVKSLMMDASVVVGIGNIYASESLYHAGILPSLRAGKITRARYQKLSEAVRRTLDRAIAAGGTSLKDFHQVDGKPGYFAVELAVYGRAGLPCLRCRGKIRRIVHNQRATFFCPKCQH